MGSSVKDEAVLLCMSYPWEKTAMAEARYDTLEMYDGIWAVIDVWTGDAAEVNGIKQIGLEWEQADDLAAC
ncbi:hypothetical protein [Brucella intermedia]|uniref:hypothetical protein n=1 Tax=Brucella intermedia TaxID=94625 RepID=UPI001FCE8A97|nr:hypothetical protein [Brucella intermedia]